MSVSVGECQAGDINLPPTPPDSDLVWLGCHRLQGWGAFTLVHHTICNTQKAVLASKLRKFKLGITMTLISVKPN